jgi:peptidyl-prolyl cis-trans isomerase SurA
MRLHQTFKRICLAALTTLVLAAPARAQNVVVMVNGEPITNYDIDQRTKLTVLSTRKAPSRQQVLDELIEEKLKIKEAKKFGVDPSASDIDQAYASMSSRMRLSAEQLTKTLDAQGIRPETLRSRIKADMVWGSLVRGRFKDSLLVSERDVQGALGPEDKAASGSFEYRMRPIVLVVPQGAGSGVTEARKREAEALRERIQSCDEADGVFRTMQNATIRSTVTKTSADLPQPLRELLDKTPIGRLTPPEITRQGVEMVAVCGRSPTTVDSPKKREIREKMFTQKYEARAKAYLQEIRKAGMIEYR